MKKSCSRGYLSLVVIKNRQDGRALSCSDALPVIEIMSFESTLSSPLLRTTDQQLHHSNTNVSTAASPPGGWQSVAEVRIAMSRRQDRSRSISVAITPSLSVVDSLYGYA